MILFIFEVSKIRFEYVALLMLVGQFCNFKILFDNRIWGALIAVVCSFV